MRKTILPGLLVLACMAGITGMTTAPAAEPKGFVLQDQAGKQLDILLDGLIAARYMYAYDKSTPARLTETYKPYLHVFDAEGKSPITKGPGGLFPHHRGIFIGWNKITFQGKLFDRWHMKGGEIVHQKFLTRQAAPDEASFTSLTHWNDAAGQPFLVEERTMTFRRAPAPARLLIDFHTRLTAPRGDVALDGDPEHSGIQYRPANEVDATQTTYVLPKEDANCRKDLDYPWLGVTYVLSGKKYSVVEMNAPGNPKNTRFSAYRDYGRFGAFPKAEIKQGQSLALDYRFLIVDGEMPSVELIQKAWDAFAHVAQPSPVPKVTTLPGENKKVANKKPAKPSKKTGGK